MESTKDRAASLRVIYIEFLDEVVSLSEHIILIHLKGFEVTM